MEKELENAYKILKKGGIILYPTDTICGIGCDATNFEAVKKVYDLKQRNETKSMICLVNDTKMLKHYIKDVPETALSIVNLAIKPTTIIYDKPIRVAENLIAQDNTLAVRVVHHEFCKELIKKLKRPIVSTSANITGEPTPNHFKEISDDILKGVDYVVNLQNEKNQAKPSSIIKIDKHGIVKIIRE